MLLISYAVFMGRQGPEPKMMTKMPGLSNYS